jgi:hypothetical protein
VRTWLAAIALIGASLVGVSVANAGELPLIEPCAKTQNLPCIESFSVIDASGKLFEGNLTGKSSSARENFASQSFTGTEYEWNVPGVSQPNGNSFFKIIGEYFPLGAPYCWLPNQQEDSCDHSVDEIALLIYPSMEYSAPQPKHFPLLSSDKICGTVDSPSLCYLAWDLSDKYSYQVRMKIPNSFDPGMMAAQGRTGSATPIQNADGSKSILFSGEPIESLWTINNPPLSPIANEQSTAVLGRIELSFFLQSKRSAQSQWVNRCNIGDIVTYWHNTGIGTTPTWSSSENAIIMQTGGPHFKADGSLNTGLIELQIPVKIAQCLWGIDLSRSVSASMTATYGAGSAPEVIATRSTVTGSLFTLTSVGFHYSNPKISVKFEQAVSPTPAQNEVTAPIINKTSKPKKISILCKKGKISKQIYGLSPKCPIGFKRV